MIAIVIIGAIALVVFAGIGFVEVVQRVVAWLEERRRHDCAYREQLGGIREALGLPETAAPWWIGERAIEAIRAHRQLEAGK